MLNTSVSEKNRQKQKTKRQTKQNKKKAKYILGIFKYTSWFHPLIGLIISTRIYLSIVNKTNPQKGIEKKMYLGLLLSAYNFLKHYFFIKLDNIPHKHRDKHFIQNAKLLNYICIFFLYFCIYYVRYFS